MRVHLFTPEAPEKKLDYLHLSSTADPKLHLQIAVDGKTKGPFEVTVERRFSWPIRRRTTLVSKYSVNAPGDGGHSRRVSLAEMTAAQHGPARLSVKGIRAQEISVSVHDRDTGDGARTRILVVPLFQHLVAKLLCFCLGIPIIWMFVTFYDKLADDSGFALILRTANFLLSSAFVSIIAKALNRHGLPFGGIFSRVRSILIASAVLLVLVAVLPPALLVRLHNRTESAILFSEGGKSLPGKTWKTMLRNSLPIMKKEMMQRYCVVVSDPHLYEALGFKENGISPCPSASASETLVESWFDIGHVAFQCKDEWEEIPKRYLWDAGAYDCTPDRECLIKKRDDNCLLIEKQVPLRFQVLNDAFPWSAADSDTARLVTTLPVTSKQELESAGLLRLAVHDLRDKELVWAAPASFTPDTSLVALHWSCDTDCRRGSAQTTNDVLPIPMTSKYLRTVTLAVNGGAGGDREGTLSCQRTTALDTLHLHPLRYEGMTIAGMSVYWEGTASSYEKTAFNDGQAWFCAPDPKTEAEGRAELVISQSTAGRHPFVAFPRGAAPQRLDIVDGGKPRGSVICKDLPRCKEAVVFERIDFRGKSDDQMAFPLRIASTPERRWVSEWIWGEDTERDRIWVCRCDNPAAETIAAAPGAGFDVYMSDKNDKERVGWIAIKRMAPHCHFDENDNICPVVTKKVERSCFPPVTVKGSRCSGEKEYHGCDC